MVRVVLDTNVVVSACLRLEGAPARIIELALLDTFAVYLSDVVLREYREVLARPRFSHKLERVKVLMEGSRKSPSLLLPVERSKFLQTTVTIVS